MSGPTLQLNITAPGRASVEASVSAVERLAEALRTLPAASAQLAKLQKQLVGVQAAPSGLAGGTDDLKALVGEIKNLGAQLNTSFGSLEETIKKGWGRAAKAELEGEAQLGAAGAKSQKAAAERLKKLEATYAAAGVAGQNRLVLKARSMLDQDISPAGVTKAVGTSALTQAQALSFEQAEQLRFKYLTKQQASAEAKLKADAKTALAADHGTALILNSLRDSAAAKLRGDAAAAKLADHGAALYINAQRDAAAAKLKADAKTALAADHGTALYINAQRDAAAAKLKADAKAALAADHGTALILNSLRDSAAAKLRGDAAAAKLADHGAALYINAQRDEAAKKAKAIKDAADVVAKAALAAEARYQAMPQRTQDRAVLRARTQLDKGFSPAEVAGGLGTTATALAQGTTTANARAKAFNDTIAAGKPKIEGYSHALRDMHSGLRGVASGFGQMALTWGAIGPLLAGAALSQSFVQTIKQGAQVRQDLEVLRVLSQESAASVQNLENSLLSLARTGPFGPREIAEAMKTLSLAGLSAAEVGKALKPTLDFAITGGVGIQKSAESLVAIGTAYGYQADQFSTVADAVSKAAAISMSSVEGMMESFRASSIVAQAYGVSLKDAATSQALLANIGIRGSAAGTAMRQMYSELSGATASTRKAMERLNVAVVDQQGKMKPLITIMTDLSKALSGLDGPARIAAIQALSNERGSKSIVAALTAVESKAKEVGSTAANELERIRQLIETSEGFNAIAAAQLASTPLNLMKGVSASFQAALMDAFKALEPVLILTASKLREVFNSPEFRSGIEWMVTAMGSLTSMFVENLGALKTLAYIYAGFKGFQVLQLTLSAAAVGAGLLTGKLVATATGIMTVAEAAAVATPAIGRLATAAGLLGVALRFLGPVAIALTVAAAAWELYNSSKSKGEINAEANAKRQDLTLAALTEEAKRLDLITVELKKGTEARLAEVLAKEREAAASRGLKDEEERAPLRKAAERAKSLVLTADLQAAADPSAKNTQVRDIRRAEAAQASEKLREFNVGASTRENDISFQQQVVKSLQAEVNMRSELQNKPKALGTDTWDSAGTLAALSNQKASELSLLKKDYDDREKEAQLAYRRQMELLELSHKGKLISEGEYTYKAGQYSEGLYTTELRNLENYIRDSKSLITSLKSDPKKASKAQGAVNEIEAELRQLTAQHEHLTKLNAAREASRGGAMQDKVNTDLSKLREVAQAQEDKYQADLRTLGMSPGLIAAEQAKANAWALGTAALRPMNQELERSLRDLKALNEMTFPGATDGGEDQENRIKKLEAHIAQLKERIATGTDAVGAAAGRAGDAAKKSADLSAETWRKYVEQGQNAYTVLESSRNSFMQGWVDSGREIWHIWLTEGKTSAESLRKLFQKALTDITYQRLILKPFSQLGEGLFDKVLKPATLAGSNGRSGMEDLKAAAEGLGSTFGDLGSAAWQMLTNFGQGLALMMQTAGASSSGNWLQSLINAWGGTGVSNGGGGNVGFSGGGGAMALGNAFGSDGMALFAKGAVFSAPRAFKFGSGGSQLGIMGEAGPEAIMPLSRGAGGDLGVRVHNPGTQKAAGTSIVIENYGSGDQPQVSRESKPDGSELIRVVLNATAKDISRGGPVRKSIQGAVKTTPNLPRW